LGSCGIKCEIPVDLLFQDGYSGGFNLDEYLESVLRPCVGPTFNGGGEELILQEDNDGAYATQTYWNPCAQ
jgi:hypothetical protein